MKIYENLYCFCFPPIWGRFLTMFAAVAIGIPAPLGAGHILWINLITDSLPALALGMDGNDRENLMRQSPRRTGESLFAGGGWFCMAFYGCLIAAVTLGAFFQQTGAFTGADVCIYCSGTVGALFTRSACARSRARHFRAVLGKIR